MRSSVFAATVMLAALTSGAVAQTANPTAPAVTAPAAAPVAASTPQRQDMSPEAKARYEKFRAACGADLQTHCAAIARGPDQSRGEMRQCIETNKTKFSASCQAAVAERDANREARKQALPAATEKPKS
jgi:hypothetical protein